METAEKATSALDILSASEESFNEASQKVASESSSKTNYLRITQDGTTTVRILPLAPYIGEDGKPILPMERKGYEYPVRDIVLKINVKNKDGKKVTQYVNVVKPSMVFNDLKADLFETYAKVVSETCSDKKIVDKVNGNSFGGGLKYSSQRAMYVYNVDNLADGIQVLNLSYSQYRDLEDLKMKLWKENREDGEEHLCPVSSIHEALPIQIERKTENKKTSYAFSVSRKAKPMPLTEEQVSSLIGLPRLPEVLYKYSQYHLEASIEFLKQYDEENGLNVMKSDEIKEVITVIKACLPADDNSHFKLNKDDNDSASNGGATVTLDDLWNEFDSIANAGKDDKSEEGAALRGKIREFIEENDIDIHITRKMTNEEALNEISDILDGDSDKGEKDEKKPAEKKETPAEKREEPVDASDDDEKSDDEEDAQDEEGDDDEEEEVVRHRPQRRR